MESMQSRSRSVRRVAGRSLSDLWLDGSGRLGFSWAFHGRLASRAGWKAAVPERAPRSGRRRFFGFSLAVSELFASRAGWKAAVPGELRAPAGPEQVEGISWHWVTRVNGVIAHGFTKSCLYMVSVISESEGEGIGKPPGSSGTCATNSPSSAIPMGICNESEMRQENTGVSNWLGRSRWDGVLNRHILPKNRSGQAG